MVRLTAEGRPLTEAMTTRTLMMTTALEEFYFFLDVVEIDDDGVIYDREIEAIFFAYARPVIDARAAERIDSHGDFRIANQVQVNHVSKICDVFAKEIVRARGGGFD